MTEEQICRAAKKRAEKLAAGMPEYRGDEAAEEMFANHLMYLVFHHMEEKNLNRDLDPRVKKGIAFFEVGHNATHYFYMGMRDGKRFQLSIGPGSYDEEGNETSVDEHITEVADWHGYWGHY